MNERTIEYRIFRKRQGTNFWVDITSKYSCTGYFTEAKYIDCLKYAVEYWEAHRNSDAVKIEKTDKSDIIISETDYI